MLDKNKTFLRSHATTEEKTEMYENSIRIGSFDYEEYEALADKARSREEYDFYMERAHWAFKSSEAVEFGA